MQALIFQQKPNSSTIRLKFMETPEKLQISLQSVLSGDPWYGPATYAIIDSIPFEAAYETPPGSVHNIAGIMLHMLGWTLEVTERMYGKDASDPAGGDWPDPDTPDEDRWQTLINDFKLANTTLSGIIQSFPSNKWQEPISDHRFSESGKGDTYQEMIEGLIQHHVYHSGQLALLNRIVG
jgi:uncharacterized damage-inducible protein DinB